MRKRRAPFLAIGLTYFFCAAAASATIPPREGASWPQAYHERIAQQPNAFTYSHAYLPLMARIQQNRLAVASGQMTLTAAAAAGGTVVSGTKEIPVLLATFSDTAGDPFPPGNLQTELFDGPWPSGTMAEYYQEISYGAFTVTGTVFPWQALANDDTFYEGGCNGLCVAANTAKLLEETLDSNDAAINFSQYDNDGPDGVPNSGDDDGFVDFVAFVHPENGGECGTSNLWSHRWVYSGWTGTTYTTNDSKAGGGKIQIDDYVLMPAVACDGSTMIQIGVFAHEFGHAFGLPDLYDTDPDNGTSAGIGNWGLMASGSWGGDGASPERPSHMSAWSKHFLGWLTPTEVTGDLDPASLSDIEGNAFAYKVPISANQYFLVSNRQQRLFDSALPAAGILIWQINETVIDAGLINNRVNADENNKGVDLEEADGLNQLDDAANRGDAGDMFPGSAGRRKFDKTSSPSSSGSVAVCAISDSANPMTAKILVTTDQCEDGGGEGDDDDDGSLCSSVTAPSVGGGQRFLYLTLLLLPVLLAAGLAARDLWNRKAVTLRT